jgi:gamma-glutamyl-gamma-aminobutyrate hydrolase PuuD
MPIMPIIAVCIGVVLLIVLFGKSRAAGVRFSIFMLIAMWLAFFGGWDRVVTVYHHWADPKPQHTLKMDKGIEKIVVDLKTPVPGDSGRPVR